MAKVKSWTLDVCLSLALLTLIITSTTIVLHTLIYGLNFPWLKKHRATKVLLIGGSGDEAQASIEEFHPESHMKNSILDAKLREGRRCFSGGVFHHNKVVISGGAQGTTVLHSTEFYNQSNNNSFTGPPMIVPLGWSADAVVEDKLYVCSGFMDNNQETGLCQFYDERLGNWNLTQGLNISRYGARAANLNNELYVVGGYSKQHSYLKTTERYDAENERWEPLSPTNQARYKFGLAALRNYLFACGGWVKDGGQWVASNSCEVYSLNDDSWTIVANLTVPRANFEIIEFNGQLIAMGGHGEAGDTVEVFDLDTAEWTLVETKLKLKREDFVAVVV